MKQRKSFIAGFLTALLVASLVGTAFASSSAVKKDLYYNGISVTLDGKKLDLQGDREPFIINGTTFLPLRAVAEALGLDVDWDGATATVRLTSAAPEPEPSVSTPSTSSAYGRLTAWIMQNGKNDGNGTYFYLTPLSDGITYACFYDTATQTVSFVVDSVNSYNERSYEQLTFNMQSKYYFDNGETESYSSKDTFAKSSFSENMTYKMSTGIVAGTPANVLAAHEQAAKNACLAILTYIDILFDNGVGGGYSVSDLGFTSFSQSSSSAPAASSGTGSTSKAPENTSPSVSSSADLDALYQQELDSINTYYSTQIKRLNVEKARAVEDVKGNYAARTGGMESSAARTAAENVEKRYNDRIKALEKERDQKLAQLNAKYGQ